ncbi:unnamed protein product, partial [Didymodactylos carnosus]
NVWNNRKCTKVNRSVEKASLDISLEPFTLNEKTDVDLGTKFFYVKLLSNELDAANSFSLEWLELVYDLICGIRHSYVQEWYIPARTLFQSDYDNILKNLNDIADNLSLDKISDFLKVRGSHLNVYYSILNVLKLNPYLHKFVLLVQNIQIDLDLENYIRQAEQLASLYLCQFELFRTHSLLKNVYNTIEKGFEYEFLDLTPTITLDLWPKCLEPTLDAIGERFGQKLASKLRALPFCLVSKWSREGIQDEDGHIEFCYS